MKIEAIRCDRCGCEEHPDAGNVVQTAVKLHRAGRQAVIEAYPDLCLRCFDTVQAAVQAALQEAPVTRAPAK